MTKKITPLKKIKQAKRAGLIDKKFNPKKASKTALRKILTDLNRNSKRVTNGLVALFKDVMKRDRKSTIITLSKTQTIENIIRAVSKLDTGILYPQLKVGNITYSLSDDKISELLRQLKKQGINALNKVVEFEEFTRSDGELMSIVTGESIVDSVELVFTDFRSIVQRKKLKGAFFKYTHKMDFDLTRYQIYNTPTPEVDCCLVHSMILSNVLTDSEIFSIKSRVKSSTLPWNKVKEICEEYNFGISLKKHIQNRTKTYYYNKTAERQIKLGLIDEHYFIIEKVPITSYAINNYFDICELDNWNYIYSDSHIIGRNKTIDSFAVISHLMNNKDTLLESITNRSDILKTNNYKDFEFDYDKLEYEECNVKPIVYKPRQAAKYNPEVLFFDFETTTDGDEHIPYMLCIETQKGERRTYKGPNMVNNFLNDLTCNTICYAHNLGYDLRFILKKLTAVSNTIEKSNSKNISLKGKFHKKSIDFKCTYAMISEPLKKFPKMFGLTAKKEVMPYGLYNSKTVELDSVPISDARQYLKDDEEYKELIKNIDEWKLRKPNDHFDHIKYSEIYCIQDVNLTKQGFNIFNSWCKEQLNMDCSNYLTLASLANAYLVKEGCYDGCYQLSGIVRMFIQKCVVGGRTMCSENEKSHCKTTLNDFDAVSLYPSAMVRLGKDVGGFLQGTPRVIEKANRNMDFLNSVDGYFVKINITKNNKHYKFPLINRVNDNGIRQFDNDLIGEFFVDKITLEDLINFHNIEFTIDCGYYFHEGRNNNIDKVMTFLFSKRLELKKQKNPAQVIYKLLMNSSYGVTCLKPIDTEVRILNKADTDTYIANNYTDFKYHISIPNSNLFKIKSSKPIYNHFNSCHVGTEILSMSKRLMNEVICLVDDLGIEMRYQDTDSMHIDDSRIDELSKAYKAKYNKELIGKSMGQFHCDFDFKSDDDNPVSVESYFLGKKSYVDKIKIINDGKVTYDYHMRMKGIPNACLNYKIKNEYDNNPMELYKDLYNGEKLTFNLLQGLNCKFEAMSDYTIKSRTRFDRTVKF